MLQGIIWNVVGGVIVAILILAFQWIVEKVRQRAFRQVFGDDIDAFYVIYPSYRSPSRETTFPKPPSIVPRPTFLTTNLTTINSNASTRGMCQI